MRKSQNLTFRALSDLIKDETGVQIDASGLKRIETGAREPRLNEALAIAQALSVGLDYLVASGELRARYLAAQMVSALDALDVDLELLQETLAEGRSFVAEIEDSRLHAWAADLLNLDEFEAVVTQFEALQVDWSKLSSRLRHPSRLSGPHEA